MKPRRFRSDEQGATSVMEFVLVFPLLYLIVGTIVQLGLIGVGQVLVEHAAFNAARSAIVHIPDKTDAEGRNQVATNGAKLEQIRNAAATTMVAATPSLADVGAITGGRGGAPTVPATFGAGSYLTRLVAARRLTRVELSKASYGEHEPVRVQVEFDFILRVPGVARMLGRPHHGFVGSLLGYHVTTLRAEAVLLNHGRTRGPDGD